MATKIITKTGSGAPTTSDVDRGELAVDLTNKQLYTNDGSSIIKLGSGAGEGQWSLAPNGDDIYYDDGNVGIGAPAVSNRRLLVTDPSRKAVIKSESGSDACYMEFSDSGTGAPPLFGSNGDSAVIGTNSAVSLTVDKDGNVGVRTTNPLAQMHIANPSGTTGLLISRSASGTAIGDSTSLNITASSSGAMLRSFGDMTFRTAAVGGNPTTQMMIDENGLVGIGMTPTRSTFDLSAKEQLAEWKTKAKKAPWPIVTDGAFEQEPTEDLVAQWIETRAAGDRLQVNGNGSFTGFVNAGDATIGGLSVYNSSAGGCGLRFTTGDHIRPASNTGAAATSGTISIGDAQNKFKDAYFSGDVNADTVKTDRVGSSIGGRAGLQFASNSDILPIASDGTLTNGVASLGRNTDGNFKDAYFSGFVRGAVLQTNNGNSSIALQIKGTTANLYARANGTIWKDGESGIQLAGTSVRPLNGTGSEEDALLDIGRVAARFKDAYFSGTVSASNITRNGSPVIDTKGLISTLTTLRNATKDETTLEGLRDSIGNAIGGLIEKFEAEIATMPTGDES